MLVGYDYSSGEENDYIPDDSVIIEKPKAVVTTEPKPTKSIIGISAPKLKASLREPPLEPNAKRPKLFSSSSRLQDLLPKPIHTPDNIRYGRYVLVFNWSNILVKRRRVLLKTRIAM